jgi:glycolate oxidase FAD binding subunit
MSSPAQSSLTRLEEIVGSAMVVTDPTELSAWSVDRVRPWAVVQPTEVAQVAEIIRCVAAERLALIPCGGRTKLGIGMPPDRYDVALDLSRMNRVLAYDPEDLTLGVEPGVRIADLRSVLLEQKQFLPLTVPFADRATLGGIAATNSNSPMRHSYGGVRDFCLGMEFVTGDGLQAKSGGRVVKNVTGYDLHKMLIGSLGTLAVITRLNFRTFPIPQAARTFVATFSDAAAAFSFCRAIAKSVLTPEIVEVADPGANQMLVAAQPAAQFDAKHWSVFVRAVGHQDVVDRYDRELSKLAAGERATGFVPAADSDEASLLSAICEFPRSTLDSRPNAIIFRIGILPTSMPSLLETLRQIAEQSRLGFAALARATGFIYAVFLPENGVEAAATLANVVTEAFRSCVKPEIAAQAMLEWCPTEIKAAAGSIWGVPRPDFALMKKMKGVFDPQGILSPGRFMGGS